MRLHHLLLAVILISTHYSVDAQQESGSGSAGAPSEGGGGTGEDPGSGAVGSVPDPAPGPAPSEPQPAAAGPGPQTAGEGAAKAIEAPVKAAQGAGSGKSAPEVQRFALGGPGEESAGEGGPKGDKQKPRSGGPTSIKGKAKPGTDATESPDETVETASPGATTPPPAPEEPCNGNIIERKMGSDVTVSAYDAGHYNQFNSGPVSYESLLDCDMESPCCWNNNGPPNDLLEFSTGDGKIARMTEGPDGKFLIAATPCGAPGAAEAQLVSCTIPCTNMPVRVSIMHWHTNAVQIEVCTRHAFFNSPTTPLLNCVEVPPEEAPGPSVVELPPGRTFDVVIVAKNMVASGGDLALLDNIRVDYILCPLQTPDLSAPTTTTEATTTGTTQEGDPSPETPETSTSAGPEVDEEECAAIECDFEDETMCLYNVVSESERRRFFRGPKINTLIGAVAKKISEFGNRKGRIMNYVTGIYGAAEGERYAAVYLKQGNLAIMRTTYTLKYTRVIRLKYYGATRDMELFGCCVDSKAEGAAPNCKPLSNPDPMQSDRKWQSVQFVCEEGTDEIMFMCSSMDSKNQGACGVDNITLHVYDESLYDPDDPEAFLPSACEETR